jgi:hypothetical protein
LRKSNVLKILNRPVRDLYGGWTSLHRTSWPLIY